ncbi:LuxR family transcriptional regulator [Shimia sp.]|uniref:LuxR family transcriptional regulator n=1 Tax=Shimia sp. TaxID=1954381 RepID=UPI003298FDD7
MKDTLDYIEAVMNETSLEALWDRHVLRMADYGFDKIIYGYTNFRSGLSLGDVEDFFILSNHSRDYLDKFLGEGLYFHGPMMNWTLKNTGAQSWNIAHKAMQSGQLSDRQRQVYEVNQQYGMHAGYTISFPTVSSRTKGAISLGAHQDLSQHDVDEIWARKGRGIELINNVAHLKIHSLPYTNPERELTKRQREVLEWVGDGKTIQDIATLIGRTPATVEKHLRLARDSMNVETTAQALLKASFMHQIYLPESQT